MRGSASPSPQRSPLLVALEDRLLVQVPVSETSALQTITDAPGSGLVLTGKNRRELLKASRALRDQGYEAPILLDVEAYHGSSRNRAADPISLSWVREQLAAGVTLAVPNAGYVGEDDADGLRQLIRRSRDIERGMVLLPLHTSWLRRNLGVLRTELESVTSPIGLILEHRDDPLSVQATLTGALQLLEDGREILPLRCDVSAIGLAAAGAVAAAYGIKSSLRHLYPEGGGGFGGGGGPEAAFWEPGLGFHSVEVLEDVAAGAPDGSWWDCHCAVCGGRTVRRLASVDRDEVRRHNVAAMLRLRDEVLYGPAGDERAYEWRQRCVEAMRNYQKLDESSALKPPPGIEAWFKRFWPTSSPRP